jgi:hypothetical protein
MAAHDDKVRKNKKIMKNKNIKELEFYNLEEAIAFLENLDDNFIFRGHTDKSFKLQTTLKRESKYAIPSPATLIEQFKARLARHGLIPTFCKTNLDWLEYARHHGVPSPLLDFTYSPYIALFFAFNGVKQENGFVAIYALNIMKLADAWACEQAYYIDREKQPDKWKRVYEEKLRKFIAQDIKNLDLLFEKGYPLNLLQFIPYPKSFNERMLRQQGVFLYDTLVKDCNHVDYDWRAAEWLELEEWINMAPNPKEVLPNGTEKFSPIAYKILIPKKEIGKAFKKLDLMNITAGALFNSVDAVAQDIKNAYFYNTKIPIVR